jgi:pyruvate dehydrogenase complex dehydrogenase (E1) component
LGVTGDLYLSVKQEKASNGNGSTNYPPQFFGPKPKTEFEATAAGLAQFLSLGGRRIPIVSVHDGEPGLLDNIGSIVGSLQKTMAIRKHSKSGTPRDVYAYHHIEAASVAKACIEALEASAQSTLRIDSKLAAHSKVLAEIVSV